MLELEKFLTEKKLVGHSNFAGFVFKIKDCALVYDMYNKNTPIYPIPFDSVEEFPSFSAIILDKLEDKHRETLFGNSTRVQDDSKTSIIISNSKCNLNCSYCINSERAIIEFPSPEKVIALKNEYKYANTLEITGGEPTVDMVRLKDILVKASPLFDRTHIYTNGINLNNEFIDFLGSIKANFRIIIGVDTVALPGAHINLEALYDILNKITVSHENVRYSINLLCSGEPNQMVEGYESFLEHCNIADTIKLTSPMGSKGTDYYIKFAQTFVDLSDIISKGDSPHLRGKSFTGLNFQMMPSNRGAVDCSFKKISLLGDKFINCIYTSSTNGQFTSPLEMSIANMQSNKCLKCSHYPFECESNIGTESCIAYEDRCLRCPALNVCHKKCALRGELSEEDCLFLVTQNAFEHWLNIKDKTFKEVAETWSDRNTLPI